MRILQVLLDPRIGGAEAVAKLLEDEWLDMGVWVKTVHLDPQQYQRGGRIERLVRIRSAIRSYRPDVILSHTAMPSLYTRLSAPLGVPICTVLHSGSSARANFLYRVLERILLIRTSAVIAVGERQRTRFLHDTRWGGPVEVIPNPVRSDIVFSDGSEHNRTNVMVGNVARIIESKDPAFWLEVAKRVSEVDESVSFCWWGPLSESERCGEIVREVIDAENPRIMFAGPTSDIPGVLAGVDVFFTPSRWESMSMAIHEASLAGVPVVCTTGVGSVLDREIRTFEFEEGSLDGAISAIREALNVDRAELARSSSFVSDTLAARAIAERYLRVLSSV